LDRRVRTLEMLPVLHERLSEAGIVDMFEVARAAMAESAPYQEALRSAPAALGPYRRAVARAIVASAIVECDHQDWTVPIATDSTLRDEVVTLLNSLLGDVDMGSGGGW